MNKQIRAWAAGVVAMAAVSLLLNGCAKNAAPNSAANESATVAEAATPQASPAAEIAAPPPASDPASLSASSASAVGPVAPVEVKWASSFAEATKQAKAQNKLILVDFWADYCGWCKKLDAEVYVSPEFARAAAGVIVVKVDTQGAESEVAQRYGVSGLPTILFLTPEGKTLGRIGGYLPTAQFMPMMQNSVDLFRAIPGVKARFAANPNDLGAAQGAMEVFAKLDDFPGAEKALASIKTLDPQNGDKAQAHALLLYGDMYARNDKLDAAIPQFLKSASVAKEERDIVGAHRAAAMCYAIQGKYDKAESQLKTILDSSKISEDGKQDARQMLEKVQQAKGQG